MANSKYKPGDVIEMTDTTYISYAHEPKGGQFYWSVKVKKSMCDLLTEGYMDTVEGAKRAARNFIRHNQNAVYD